MADESVVRVDTTAAVEALREYAASLDKTDSTVTKLESRLRALATLLTNAVDPAKALSAVMTELNNKGLTEVIATAERLTSVMEQNSVAAEAQAAAYKVAARGADELAEAQTRLNRAKTTLVPPIRGNQGPVPSGNLFDLGGQVNQRLSRVQNAANQAAARSQQEQNAAYREANTAAARARTSLVPPIQGNQGVPSGGSLLSLGRQRIDEQRAADKALIASELGELKAREQAAALIQANNQKMRSLDAELQFALQRNVAAYNEQAAKVKAAAARAAGAGGGRGAGGGGYYGSDGDGTFGGGFKQAFIGGHGGGAGGLGYTLGQAAKFGVIYGSMYKVLDGTLTLFKDAFQQAVSYQKSVAELQFQTGQSADASAKLANELQVAATQYGESGSVGIEAGQKALGLYGASGTGTPQNVQDATAITAARVVSQLAYVTGKPVDELVEGLGALNKAFGQGAESIASAADIVVKFGQIYHINAADLAAAAPKLAPLAQTVGFSQKEAIALEAATAARTGLSASQAVSGLDTLLAKGLSGPLIAEMAKLGIDQTKSVRDQLFGEGGLAEIFNKNPDKQGEILGAAGRGGTNRDVVASILESGSEALKTANETVTAGSLDSFTKLIQGTLGGALRELAGNAKQFSVELAQSGLFDVIGVGIKVLDGFIQAMNGLLSIVNQIPRPLRDMGVAAGFAALALKTTVPQRIGGFLTGGRAGAAAGAERATFGARIGGATPTNLIGVGLGAAAVGLGAYAESQNKYDTAMKAAQSALIVGAAANTRTTDGFDGLTESLRAASDEVNAAVGPKGEVAKLGGILFSFGNDVNDIRDSVLSKMKDAPGTLFHKLFGGGGDKGLPSVGQADYASAITSVATGADIQEAAARKRIVAGSVGQFGTFSTDDFAKGLATTSATGSSYADIIKLLNQSIDAKGNVVGAAQAASFNLNDFGAKITALALPKLTKGLSDAGITDQKSQENVTVATANIVPQIQGILRGLGIKGTPTGGQVDLASTELLGEFQKQLPGASKELLSALANALPDLVRTAATQATPVAVLNGASSSDALTNMQKLLEQASGATYQPGDVSGKLGADKGTVDFLLKQFKGTLGGGDQADYSQALILISQQMAAYGAEQAAHVKTVLTAAQKNDTTLSQSLKDGQSNIKTLAGIAVKNGDTDGIAAIVAQGGEATYKLVQGMIDTQHKAALAAIAAQAKLDGLSPTDPKILAQVAAENTRYGAESGGALTGLSQQASAAQFAAARAATQITPGNNVQAATVALLKAKADQSDAAKNGTDSIAYLNAVAGVNAAVDAQSQAILQAREQINTTAATKLGGGQAAAAAQLANAKLEVQAAGHDSVKLQVALNNFYSAQQAAAAAVLEANKNKSLLKIDLTDPVAQAKAEQAAAVAKLKSDQRLGLGSDIINQDKLNVRTAGNNTQKTKFDQYNSDLQTSLDLGKISQSSFLNSVNAEISDLTQKRSLLKKTDNMYRQYTDEINGLAKTKKDLQDSLSSQFNLGDITLPTAYDTRRYAQGFGGPAGPSGATQTVQITIYANSSQDINDALSTALGGGNGYSNVTYG